MSYYGPAPLCTAAHIGISSHVATAAGTFAIMLAHLGNLFPLKNGLRRILQRCARCPDNKTSACDQQSQLIHSHSVKTVTSKHNEENGTTFETANFLF